VVGTRIVFLSSNQTTGNGHLAHYQYLHCTKYLDPYSYVKIDQVVRLAQFLPTSYTFIAATWDGYLAFVWEMVM